MSEQQKKIEQHNQSIDEFIALANEMAEKKGRDIKLVSAALMAASGVYATFMAAGNNGYLAPGGVDKVVELYQKNLTYIQERKKQDLEAKGLQPKPISKIAGDA